MTQSKVKRQIDDYKFHHIDTQKCLNCTRFDCEEACFRGIYRVINKDFHPRCVVIEKREDMCVKCHICTTACKFRAILID